MRTRFIFTSTVLSILVLFLESSGVLGASAREEATTILDRLGAGKDVAVVLGLPDGSGAEVMVELAKGSELILYFQSTDVEELRRVRQAADGAGLLGERIVVGEGEWGRIGLADNLAGGVWVGPGAVGKVSEGELLRVLHPEGKAIAGSREWVKPYPEGVDSWSHPYHGPDNNPQSEDQLARAPYLTQFLADPKFSPMPEVTVGAGGRLFKAFGHIAHKANQNGVLNTLMGISAYNGMILWERPLKEGFMIHRSTMIATPETLYLADDESCELIDPLTGKTRDRIVISADVAEGPVWKWMATDGKVLYALVGGRESPIHTQRSGNLALGHWPWGMWEGHDYKESGTSFGFGRTLLGIDPGTKKVLWHHRAEEYVDSRALCMKNGRIYFYCPDKFLACFDTKEGRVIWRNSDSDLLEAIGSNGRAQHYVTGYATTAYLKCNDDYVFFAGPQRSRLVVASAKDGKLVWQKKGGNLQLVLREDGFYAAGPEASGAKFDYATGKVLAQLPNRRACTRATGSIDSIFFRTPGGTVRVETDSNQARHIAPMRPPCQDGVLISDGLLFWGPWMCGCQLSLYGHISLAPAGDFNFQPGADESRLRLGSGDAQSVVEFEVGAGDWPAYLHDSAGSGVSETELPRQVSQRWKYEIGSGAMPTAPIAAGDTVFFGDLSGAVHAVDGEGKRRWQAYTGGPIYFPPVLEAGRLYVGSGDGRVYAFEAGTGRLLWSYRVAPTERRIPVYGKLISTWPLAGGVAVKDGVVYAAAGIAHYDGTHVMALEGASGKVIWYNNSSGVLSEEAMSGVSLQGNLHIGDGELRFTGGGIYETARYDLETGKCLNEPHHGVDSTYQTACYAYYPHYAQYLSLDHTLRDGRTVSYDSSYEGSRHSDLQLLEALPAGARRQEVDPRAARRSGPRGAAPKRKALWRVTGNRYNSLMVAPGLVVVAGQVGAENTTEEKRSAFLSAIDLKDGAEVWRHGLPGPAVKGGTAMDGKGRIFVTLRDGQVLCFGG